MRLALAWVMMPYDPREKHEPELYYTHGTKIPTRSVMFALLSSFLFLLLCLFLLFLLLLLLFLCCLYFFPAICLSLQFFPLFHDFSILFMFFFLPSLFLLSLLISYHFLLFIFLFLSLRFNSIINWFSFSRSFVLYFST